MKEDEFWFKEAIIYAIDVTKYCDGNGDGIGDFKGLTGKLDYIVSLGVNCLWLLPFYPTPDRDNGYDVIDYYNINPDEGTFEDFLIFMGEAKNRGLKVLIDFVFHHTSDKHPWFLAARYDRNSKYRNYYIWNDTIPEKGEHSKPPAFPGAEDSTWRFDETSKSYYHHFFYHFQPDLNIKNPEVQKEIQSILDFWLSFGVDGFRIDAVSHMIQAKGLPDTEVEEPEEFLKNLNDFVINRKKTAVLMAEADVKPEEMQTYFGDGERMDLLYNFIFDNYLFLALAKKNAEPLLQSLEKTEKHFDKGQWTNFIRNLDELNLSHLAPEDQKFVMEQFAPDEHMRIYNRGIRRRFASIMEGNRKAIEMTYSLLFSLPGAPLIPYGDEIGMGEDLSQKERNSIRTPMQWSKDANAGFTIAANPIHPVIDKGDFNYRKINVEDQLNDPASLLNWVKKLIQKRKDFVGIINGGINLIKEEHPEIFTHTSFAGYKTILFIHNLSDLDIHYQLPKEFLNKKRKIVFGSSDSDKIENANSFSLEAYSFYWFEIV